MILTTLGLIAWAVNASASVMDIAGEIVAYANRCDLVELNQDAMSDWISAKGIDVADINRRGPTFQSLSDATVRAATKFRGEMSGKVCEDAIREYGPNGSVAAGLLRIK